ncbi:hypothetical protein [Nostoc sp.]|uniref:hypothetical protein n=1 Tax=Nostoc sp. TaxID=1180 RepID=UPI002FF6CF07
MSKHYYHFLAAGDFHRPDQRNWRWVSRELFTCTDWQRARSLVCLIADHKITALLTPHGRGVMLKVAISV